MSRLFSRLSMVFFVTAPALAAAAPTSEPLMVFMGEDSYEFLVLSGNRELWEDIRREASADRKSEWLPMEVREAFFSSIKLFVGPKDDVREYEIRFNGINETRYKLTLKDLFLLLSQDPHLWRMLPAPRLNIITMSSLRFTMPLYGPKLGFLDRSKNVDATRLAYRSSYDGERFLAIDEWDPKTLDQMLTRRRSIASIKTLEDALCEAAAGEPTENALRNDKGPAAP